MDSHDVRQEWADRSGEFSPGYYAYYGPDETSERVRAVLGAHVDPGDPVLELGCSSGRHLAHLHEHGFTDLTGVDVNADAFDVMADTYPDLAAKGTFHVDAIEDVVRGFADDRFAAVFSVETLQHVHPDADWVFDELLRIAEDLLLTVENEGSDPTGATEETGGTDGGEEGDDRRVNYVTEGLPLYYRDWEAVFTARGATALASAPLDRDTLRAFQPPDD